ncbi:MAG: rhodanese-like domain-containing protein, partial [Nitrosotalea sp.]
MSSHQWLAEHYNDPDLVILDARGNIPYSYAHIPNSQPLGIEKVVKTNQYGANLVIENDQAATLFGSL